jgi:HD-GYP domain-containing protein (c-di-GMP phosphodiesterase class II)
MKLLRLCAHQIRLNDPLPWNVRNEPGHLLLGKGFLLTDQAQIDALMERGVYVDQEEFEAHERAAKAAAQARPDPFTLWANILKRTGQLLRGYKQNPRFAEDMGELSVQIHGAMKEDVNAGIFEMVYGEPTGYAVSHSLQTAFVASLAAERFGWTENDRTTLIRAALTMNIAMLDMQNALTQQAAPLTPQQRAEIDAHPTRGRQILEESKVVCPDWLRTVEQHHVTTDGRGLPQDRSDISQLACMVHYADVYLAKLSPRANRPAIPVNVAARELFVKSGGTDNPYVAAIIKQMGIFPPGAFVKLANGDTAVVTRPGETANTPEVHSLISADGWVFPDAKARDTAKPEFKVVAAVPRGNVLMRLDRQKLFGYAAA